MRLGRNSEEKTAGGGCGAARAKRARRGEAGFTLLETVIAMIVMMTVGLGASALFLYSITNNSAAGARSQAIAVAQQQVEQLRSVDWDDPLLAATANPVVTNVTTGGGAGNGVADERHRFVVTKTVTAQNPVPAAGGGNRMTTKLITITVAPVVNNAPWAAAAVTITTVRSTLQRGPY
jgi:Tfp pilus assembly protein PilV